MTEEKRGEAKKRMREKMKKQKGRRKDRGDVRNDSFKLKMRIK